jgi:hypothetical protein
VAETLSRRWLRDRPGRVLELGPAPVLLARHLGALGCEAFRLDGFPIPGQERFDDAVPALPGGFAGCSGDQVRVWTRDGRFKLIAVLKVFEHLDDPLAALGALRELVADDGVVFMRIPDHEVSGFRPGPGQAIHHCLDSILELLAQGGDRFALAGTRTLRGSGLRDLVLRPVKENLGAGWDPRLDRLASSGADGAAAHPSPRLPMVAVFRPGAIGDVLMTLNLVPALRERFPGHLVHFYCHRWIGQQLGALMQMAGVTEWKDMDTFRGRRADYAEAFIVKGYPLAEGFPRKPMRRHLIQYFAEELGLDAGGLPSLQASLAPMPGLERPYATLHPTARWSVYKSWPLERWAAVLRACPGMPVYQIGAADDPRVPGARHDFMGTPLLVAAALLANARLHLGVDSFTNHLSHYRWNGRQVPSVILWGSTQRTATGYPHNVNLSLDLPCQPCFREDAAISMFPHGLGPCPNPLGQTYEAPRHACMAGIPVERVVAEARLLWERGR